VEVNGRPRVGVSSCLLGEAVRWDGGHKRDADLVERLGRDVDWVPVCPELEMGLGTPREPINLVRTHGDIRLMTTITACDLTDAMRQYAKARVAALAQERLSGYVLKTDSPSCGMIGVRVHPGDASTAEATGRGLFAEVLMNALPDLPVEDDRRLKDPRALEGFLARVRAFHRAHDV
jgi:uncharacterized protein YbbK (DUF523 family)